MKKIQYIIALIGIVIGTQSNAQTLSDALRLSDMNYLGTARTMAVGGSSFGALGGDQGGIFYNPATLATYYRSEFMIAPYLLNNRSTADLNKNSTTGPFAQKFGIVNMGFVSARSPRMGKWKTSNLAVTLTKIQDYGGKLRINGDTEGSIVQRFQERANTKHKDDLDGFEAGLAYEVGAIYDFDKDKIYESDIIKGQVTNKEQSVNSSGYKNEFAISWAGNYNDKFSFGFSLGIPTYSYTEKKEYIEKAIDGKSQFKALTYNENLKTEGTGINLKLGVTATPFRFLRIGLAVQSPTAYSLKDVYSTEMTYTYEENNVIKGPLRAQSKEGSFDYGYTSPWNTYGSIALMAKRSELKGFISAGVKYTSFTTSFFNLTKNSSNTGDAAVETDLNNQINYQLRNNLSYSFGSELAYRAFRLRGGLQLNGSPYAVDENKLTPSYSLGFGFRFNNRYIDFAYRNSSSKYGYSPYQLLTAKEQPVATVNNRSNSFMATVGFMFGSPTVGSL